MLLPHLDQSLLCEFKTNVMAFFSNSGPKGVINDWRKYKQLEVEQKQEQKKEMERLIKKLSMSCRSDLDLEKDEQKKKELQEKIQGKVRRMRVAIILMKSP